MQVRFKVLLHPDPEDGGFGVTVPALPGCMSQGENEAEALANIKEAIELYLDTLDEQSERPAGAIVQVVVI